ncbi:hypothetical protein [Burkholderia gladioli]|uniref:hypothetical protein n=1 Tax=Burkholderia gladioli TaxID=28095 RepID=UPI00163E3BE6|nr:hypothetical protein [Burkholderia gladioli]
MTRKTKYRLKQISTVALALLTGFEALPAFAQSDAEHNVSTSPDEPPAVVTYVEDPAPQTPTLYPRVSFQALGSKDFHLYVDLNLHAYHFDRQAKKEYDFNENNWGGGLEYTNDVVGVMVGYYRNSIWRPSWYLLGRYSPVQFDFTSKDRMNVGIVAGALSGYTEPTYGNGYRVVQEPSPYNGELMPNLVPARVVTGEKPRGIMPAAGLIISYEHDHKWGVNLIAVPNFKSAGIYGFLGVQGRIAIPSSWF